MAKTKISQFDANAANNTDLNSISIAEGTAPSNINNAIRELMSQLADLMHLVLYLLIGSSMQRYSALKEFVRGFVRPAHHVAQVSI